MKKSIVVAIDIGGTNIRVAAVTQTGKAVAQEKIETDVAAGYQAVLPRIAEAIDHVIKVSAGAPLAIGLATAGVIDFEKKRVIRSPNFPGWKDVPIAKDLASITGLPVSIENDANGAAIGEMWIGAAKKWQDFIMLTLGTGVGGGVILGGKIWRGPDGAAGEIGHLTVVPDGRKCGCGNRGCLERYASASGLKETARNKLNEKEAEWLHKKTGGDPTAVGARVIEEGARQGDLFCIERYKEIGVYLGVAMAQAALLLNVTRFVIGGGLAAAFDLFEPAARQKALEAGYTLSDDKLTIVPALLGDNAGILGAAKAAFNLADKQN